MPDRLAFACAHVPPKKVQTEAATPTPRSAPDVRFRMRVIHDGTIALGPGKVQLLEAVREQGSISAAARSLNMS